MAATPPLVAAASCWGGCSGDVSVPVFAAAPTADANPEKQLSRFVLCVAFGEWAGNAFGALAFVWATGVLLGGFCSDLNPQDFWFASVMIFIEALRIFSRSYKLDSQSLFGTTRALRWMNSSFLGMLGRPQEGDEVVLIMGLWLNLVGKFPFNIPLLEFIIDMALLIPWSRRPRRPKQWQKRAVAIAYLLYASYTFIAISRVDGPWRFSDVRYFLFSIMLPVIIEGVAVLLLNFRPRSIAKLTSSRYGRILISLAKVALALCLATDMISVLLRMMWWTALFNFIDHGTAVTLLVLSLGSLQNHASHSLFGRWIDTIIHIFFLFHSVPQFPLIILEIFIPGSISSLPPPAVFLLPYMFLVVLLLIGNLQIPAAVVQILLSSLRLSKLRHDRHMGYNSLPSDSSSPNPNMVAAIAVFYVLALCQGSLYIMASILGLFSSFPRRWLMRTSKLGGKLGAKAIDLYYERAYATRMEMGVFGTAAGSTISFDNFAIESLNSSSRDRQVAGLRVLHNILLERTDCRAQDLILRVTRSSTAVSLLVGMLAWEDLEDEKIYLVIRLLAAKVVSEFAGSLRISSIQGMLKLVSSLLTLAENADAVVVLLNQQRRPGPHQTPAIANRGWCSWVNRFWQWIKPEYWSVPEEQTFSHQDLPPVQGMVILEKLARDLENCAEIFKDETANLISKTIGIIGYATSNNESSNPNTEQNALVVYSSLQFLRRLATTGEKIGAALRDELWSHPFLLTCLARVLDNDRSSSSSSISPHQVWEPAIDIIAKLALHKEAGLEIGKIQVITARLLHAFLGRHGATHMYDQSLRKVSGEALANLALWGTANCSVVLDEPGYQVIHDLRTMLSEDEHNRYVAASLLLNLCAHCHSVNLLLSHPHAREHLSSALITCTQVIEHMNHPMKDDIEGKQLESLINLAYEIGDVTREAFVRVLESQTNSGAELVQNLLRTLDSKKIPNPAYPRMRRVIVKILISILESCCRTVEKLVEDGMVKRLMDSLTKIQRSPSTVEEYRVFYGNIGVVLEDGEPMSTLVARAKVILVQHTTQTAGAPIGHHYP